MVRLLTVIIKNCSQSGRENVSSSSNASPLASYKEVPPPPSGGKVIRYSVNVTLVTLQWLFNQVNPFFYFQIQENKGF